MIIIAVLIISIIYFRFFWFTAIRNKWNKMKQHYLDVAEYERYFTTELKEKVDEMKIPWSYHNDWTRWKLKDLLIGIELNGENIFLYHQILNEWNSIKKQ